MFVDRISCLLEFIALPILMALMLVDFQTMPQFNLKVSSLQEILLSSPRPFSVVNWVKRSSFA